MEFVVRSLVTKYVPELEEQVEIVSAGTDAREGASSCPTIMGLVGAEGWSGTATPLTVELVESADLILTATSEHADAVVALSPAARTRVFPYRQAVAVGHWVLEGSALKVAKRKAIGEVVERDFNNPVTLVEPLPADGVDQLRWLVGELDAFRGVAPVTLEPLVAEVRAMDLPDPHVLGDELHGIVAAEIVGLPVPENT